MKFPPSYPIPRRLNVLIACTQIVVLLGILIGTAFVTKWPYVMLMAMTYGIAMNSAYAMMHEAEHNLFHTNPRINHFVGAVLGLFFPAPYHLMRQGHIGHHLRNRSDDEAFDLYFDGDNAFWKHLQYYGILTGLFWIAVVSSNLIAVFHPGFFSNRSKVNLSCDRPTEAVMESLNPRYTRVIQLEAISVIMIHSAIVIGLDIAPLRYFAVLFGFGYTWSALQYLHHFETDRDVRLGARNVRAFWWLDRLLLNHNLHLLHHMHPTVPWRYLPDLDAETDRNRSGMIRTYLRMWKGPRKTREHVENVYAEQIIR